MKMQPVGNQEEETVIMNGASRETYEKTIHMFDNIPVTNFDKVTESPEALVKFVCDAEYYAMRCENCNDCDKCKCQWCGLAGRPDIEAWLKQECKDESET